MKLKYLGDREITIPGVPGVIKHGEIKDIPDDMGASLLNSGSKQWAKASPTQPIENAVESKKRGGKK